MSCVARFSMFVNAGPWYRAKEMGELGEQLDRVHRIDVLRRQPEYVGRFRDQREGADQLRLLFEAR